MYPCAQAYSRHISLLPTGSLVDGALTPVNSPAATFSSRQQAAADMSRSTNTSSNAVSANELPKQWLAASQQPTNAQSNVSKASMQEMDSLLAAEKVCLCKWLTSAHFRCMPVHTQVCKTIQSLEVSIDHQYLAMFGFLCCIVCPGMSRY